VDENVTGQYDKMCSVASGCKGQKLMEREDPWCEMVDRGKPGYRPIIGVVTIGNAMKLICVCVSSQTLPGVHGA
jgi:hypothetical protein